jgi:hypothetical protein
MYSWEEIKLAVERREGASIENSLAESEMTEGLVGRRVYPVQRTRSCLEIFGGLVMGLYASLMTLAFNYLLFVWILHVNFNR